MSIVSVQPKDFILALFIRDDGERFLLGDGGYDFKDSQLHFVGNTIENDEVAKQGTDGTLLAGQVRRSAIQSFDGYIGDATVTKEAIEQMRRDFIAFFMKGHHFRVVYVDCARNAWQRKGGYLVDAPEVKELWQIHPEYHVALNFEDVNYYVYDENADGDEILAIVQSVPISSEVEGGLEWDANGAISEAAQMDNETKSVSGSNIHVTDAVVAPFADLEIEGNTSQDGTPTPSAPVAVRTVTGENVVRICGKNLFDKSNASIFNGYMDYQLSLIANSGTTTVYIPCKGGETYTVQKEATGTNNRFCVYTTSDIPSGGGTALNYVGTPAGADNRTSLTITTNASAKYLCVFLSTSSTTPSVSDILATVQIELGSTATTYEPYQAQSYEIDLGDDTLLLPNGTTTNAGVSGVFDKNTVVVSRTSSSSSTSFIRVDLEKPVTIHAGDTFTLYANNYQTIGATDAGGAYMSIRMNTGSSDDSATDVFLGSANASTTITATADKTYTRFVVRTASSLSPSNILIKPKLIVNGQDKSIELCKIEYQGTTYQDYIYKSGDGWYVHKESAKLVFNGSENWSIPNTGTANYWYNLSGAAQGTLSTDNARWLYSNYGVGGQVTSSNTTQGIFILSTGNVRIRYGSEMALADWKAKLAASNMELYYALATPTDTIITNEALLAQLNNLKEGGTLAGINNIAIVPAAGNETGTLKIQYYTKYSPVPIGGGYVWEEGGEGGPTTVINESIAEVYPVWTVPGPALNPTLENATTGEQIEFVGMVGEGQTLIVDMGAQTALLNGLNVISSMAGEFISLQVGQNTLLYSASGDAGASEIGWSPIVG